MPSKLRLQYLRQRRYNMLARAITKAIAEDTGRNIQVEIQESGGYTLLIFALDLDADEATPQTQGDQPSPLDGPPPSEADGTVSTDGVGQVRDASLSPKDLFLSRTLPQQEDVT